MSTVLALAFCLAVDSDTIKCGGSHRERVRLRHIDGAELAGPHQEMARRGKEHLQLLIADGRAVCVITTPAKDRYDRWLGDCTNSAGVNLSRAMLDAGLAVPYAGGGRVPF